MSVKERFERLIQFIEKQTARKRSMKARFIADKTAENEGMRIRELNSIFYYLTGETLMSYVRERKMMYLYKMMGEMKERDELDIEELTYQSDYDNSSSFSTGFKNVFGESPSDTFKNYDGKKYKNPLTWESLTDCSSEHFSMPQQKFGLTSRQISQFREAENLQLLYEFSDKQSGYAYQMSLACDISMVDAFDICDTMNKSVGDFSQFIEDLDKNPQNWTKEHQDQIYDIIYLCKYCRITFAQLTHLAKRLKPEGLTILDVSPEAFKYFIGQEFCNYRLIEDLLKGYKSSSYLKSEYDDFFDFFDEFMTTDACSFEEYENRYDYLEEDYEESERYEQYKMDSAFDMILDGMEEERMRRIESESLYSGNPDEEYEIDLYEYMMYSD